jgi:proteic killer suppression protein
MIKSFKCGDTEVLYNKEFVRRFNGVERQAFKGLRKLNAADLLEDLRNPPSNRLEMLKGDRKGQYSIRINDRWRLCFLWDDGAEEVEIVDYH